MSQGNKKNQSDDSNIAKVLRFAFGLIFLATGILKIFSPWILAQWMQGTVPIDLRYAVLVTLIIAVSEALLGGVLLAGYARQWAGSASCIFLIIATAALLLRNDGGDCGCFGAADRWLGFMSRGRAAIFRNGFLLVLAFYSLWCARQTGTRTSGLVQKTGAMSDV